MDRTGLRVVGFGPLAADLSLRFLAGLSRSIALPCCLELRSDDELALLRGRDQVDARALLEQTAQLARHTREVTLGVTVRDIGLPVFTFVFGLAQDSGRAAVISLARLDPRFYGLPADPSHTLERGLAEALHELGHVVGIKHCPNAACLMRFAATLAHADARGLAFCEACRRRLPCWLQPQALRDIANRQQCAELDPTNTPLVAPRR